MSVKSKDDNKSEHNDEEEKLAQLDKDELDKIADEDENDLKLLKEVTLFFKTNSIQQRYYLHNL